MAKDFTFKDVWLQNMRDPMAFHDANGVQPDMLLCIALYLISFDLTRQCMKCRCIKNNCVKKILFFLCSMAKKLHMGLKRLKGVVKLNFTEVPMHISDTKSSSLINIYKYFFKVIKLCRIFPIFFF